MRRLPGHTLQCRFIHGLNLLPVAPGSRQGVPAWRDCRIHASGGSSQLLFGGLGRRLFAGECAGSVPAGAHRICEIVRVLGVGARCVAEHASGAVVGGACASTSGVRAAFHRGHLFRGAFGAMGERRFPIVFRGFRSAREAFRVRVRRKLSRSTAGPLVLGCRVLTPAPLHKVERGFSEYGRTQGHCGAFV